MKFLIAVLLIAAVASAKVRYDGNEVWRVDINSRDEMKVLHAITEGFNIGAMGEGKDYADVLVRPHLKTKLNVQLTRAGLEHKVMIANLQDLIDAEAAKIAVQPRIFDIEQYNTFADIEGYLTDTAAANANFELASIGLSFEGRNIWQMRYSTDASAGKPIVWLDCGIHAREWVSPATCLYGIDRLNAGDPMFDTVLATYDIYIIPVNNADGYVYTWTDDRLWRKNRNPGADGTLCDGVDLNRNFEFEWSLAGASDNPCSETFHGLSPASEVETQAVQSAIMSQNVRMLFSLHAYSQMWLYSWGYTETLTVDEAELNAATKAGVDALTAVYGTPYTYGSIATTIYIASGSTVDYAYGAAGIVHSYTLELRDTGLYGFELPADQITPNAEEVWAGLIANILAV